MKKVLVLEDESSIRSFIVINLRRAGYDVIEAAHEPLGVYADGEKAFELAADESVEIRRAAITAKLVELDGYDPYEVMARKLGWSGSNVK